MTIRILLLTTALVAGVLAGFYYAYQTVITALRDIDSAVASDAMRKMNATVERPLFFLLFGAAAVLGIAVVVSLLIVRPVGPGAGAAGMVGAALLVSSVVTTVAVNVPLNDRLRAGTVDWADFAGPWSTWNAIRLAACLAGAVGLAVSALRA